MKSPETGSPETRLERWSDASHPELGMPAMTPEALGENEAWRPGIWEAVVGWGYVEPPAPPSQPEPRGRWLLDEDDFSSEHGYQPDFEGRCEFEHGEFERWL
jgi:hypothetical protein